LGNHVAGHPADVKSKVARVTSLIIKCNNCKCYDGGNLWQPVAGKEGGWGKEGLNVVISAALFAALGAQLVPWTQSIIYEKRL